MKLKELVINEGVETIEDNAFSNCKSLKKIHIPASVKSIGHQVFSGCLLLTSITIDSNNEVYEIKDGNLQTKDGKVLVMSLNKTITEISLGKEVEELIGGAFDLCTNLVNVTIPKTINKMGPGVFKDCALLETAVIECKQDALPAETFMNCENLKGFIVPTCIKKLGLRSFENCINMEYLLTHKDLNDDCIANDCLSGVKRVIIFRDVASDRDVDYRDHGAIENSFSVYNNTKWKLVDGVPVLN